MLERNRLQPPRPSAPPQTAGWCDGFSGLSSGLFASAEDYDATGILAGVDLCESRYWWMPELCMSPASTGEVVTASSPETVTAAAEEAADGGQRRSALAQFLLRAGQAARRAGSRSTAAA
jgi:hypothetical protein